MPEARGGRKEGGYNRFGPGANEHRVGGRQNYGGDGPHGGNRRDNYGPGYDRRTMNFDCMPLIWIFFNLLL